MTRAGWAIVAVAVVGIALAGGVAATGWAPSVPPDAGSTLVGRTVLQGEITPDAAEGVDSETLPRSPSGDECLDAIVRPAGRMDLCWGAYRDPHDADPNKDYYRIRVFGTFGGQSGSGVRWAVVRVRLVGEPMGNVFEGWPSGLFEGPCQQVEVSSLGVGPLPPEELCGRTEGASSTEEWSHRVTWTCVGCLIPDHANRAIALQEFVGVAAGTVPTWEIFADFGS
ncbi:MAG: hypothetical protein M3R57_02095 [Chloroflexota bacterium]|nr:hypothetical protein [Chloroflexota bacterium]